MFSFLKRKSSLLTEDAKKAVVQAIRAAEQRTSGEVRVFVESRCKYMDAIDRAVEIFNDLQMGNTKDRNAVLVYVALKDRQLAVLGDSGIHEKVGNEYWANEVRTMISSFNKDDYAAGIVACVNDIGEALHRFFPYDQSVDKNELPDDIVFGK